MTILLGGNRAGSENQRIDSCHRMGRPIDPAINERFA